MSLDAVVVGSGPNGLTAAIVLAREGLSVLVLEAADTWGGGVKTEELTLPGFLHDTCSAIHALGVGSPVMRDLPLERHGVTWVHPDVPLAHPLDDGSAALLHRSLDETCERLGADGRAWRWLMSPVGTRWSELGDDILAPPRVPRHPLLLARFGLPGLVPASVLARVAFDGEPARALFAGLAAHSLLPLSRLGTSSFGMVLGGLAHAVGWPFPRGGAGRLADALVAHLRELGGEIRTGHRVRSLSELPKSRATILDVDPHQLATIAGPWLPSRYRAALGRFRHGPAVFKMDWALSAPIPWLSEECRRAGFVHVGGRLEDVEASERLPIAGGLSDRPFVLLAQPTLFDPTRAPPGRHVAWAYCHVPLNWSGDASDRIEAHVERLAPGFRDVILARSKLGPADLERRNPNQRGGDIGGGTADLAQLFMRPVPSLHPHATPVAGLYLCSASTPPGGGVHGMGGYHAARLALRRTFQRGGGD